MQAAAAPASSAVAGLKRIGDVPAFTSHIDGFLVQDHDVLNAVLLREIAARLKAEKGEMVSNRKGWHSQRDLFDRTEPGFVRLAGHIRSALVGAARRYVPSFDIEGQETYLEGWINVNWKGGYNSPHGHSGAHLSGVYYVSVPKAADGGQGAIEFLNPAGAITREGDFGKAMVAASVSIAPQPGQILIFPSYLRHWVAPNEAERERVSIAFNMKVHDSAIEPAPAGDS